MLDRDLRKRDDLRLLGEFESKIKYEDNWDVDVGRNESLSVPLSMDEHNVASKEQENRERYERHPGSKWLEWCLPR